MPQTSLPNTDTILEGPFWPVRVLRAYDHDKAVRIEAAVCNISLVRPHTPQAINLDYIEATWLTTL